MRVVCVGASLISLTLSRMRDGEVIDVPTVSLTTYGDVCSAVKLGTVNDQRRSYGPQKRRKGKVVKW